MWILDADGGRKGKSAIDQVEDVMGRPKTKVDQLSLSQSHDEIICESAAEYSCLCEPWLWYLCQLKQENIKYTNEYIDGILQQIVTRKLYPWIDQTFTNIHSYGTLLLGNTLDILFFKDAKVTSKPLRLVSN